MCGARKKLRRAKVDTNMNRHVFFLTMLAGSAVALAQEPPHTPFPPLSPLHPRALRDDMDEVRAQVEVMRSQIDVEGIRESVRAQVAAMAPRIAAQAGAFAIERAFALAPQKVLRGRHEDRPFRRRGWAGGRLLPGQGQRRLLARQSRQTSNRTHEDVTAKPLLDHVA